MKLTARRARQLLSFLEEAQDTPSLAVKARLFAEWLRPARKVPKSLPGLSRKERLAERRAAQRFETAQIREVVRARAWGECEAAPHGAPHACWGSLQMDHWLGGSGRKPAEERESTCWMLCQRHHGLRQENRPSAAEWNRIFSLHCTLHGYVFTPHVEHAPAPRRAS